MENQFLEKMQLYREGRLTDHKGKIIEYCEKNHKKARKIAYGNNLNSSYTPQCEYEG